MLQVTEIIDVSTSPPVSDDVSAPLLFRTLCLVCGRPFWWVKPDGERGRWRRFCSAACRHKRQLGWRRDFRARAKGRGTADLFADLPP